jgi:short-subunit dehydrogenase
VTEIKGTVLLTGASGGIGQAIARALAARGAQLVLTGRRVDVLEPLAQELGARALAVDLAERDAVERLARELGEVEILVANAALPASGTLDDYSVDQVDRALDVNLRAPIVLAQLLSEGMVARGHGHLVFISSLSGRAAAGGGALYSATKFGVRGFALSLREDLRAAGVGVSTIFPGFIRDAGMFARARVDLPAGVGTRSPEDVAAAVVKAIERNKAELDVAPLGLRLGSILSGIAPELAATGSRRMGGPRIAEGLAAGGRDHR